MVGREGLGEARGLIAELGDGFLNLLAGGRGDRTLLVDDAGDGGEGHPGGFGDLVNRYAVFQIIHG